MSDNQKMRNALAVNPEYLNGIWAELSDDAKLLHVALQGMNNGSNTINFPTEHLARVAYGADLHVKTLGRRFSKGIKELIKYGVVKSNGISKYKTNVYIYNQQPHKLEQNKHLLGDTQEKDNDTHVADCDRGDVGGCMTPPAILSTNGTNLSKNGTKMRDNEEYKIKKIVCMSEETNIHNKLNNSKEPKPSKPRVPDEDIQRVLNAFRAMPNWASDKAGNTDWFKAEMSILDLGGVDNMLDAIDAYQHITTKRENTLHDIKSRYGEAKDCRQVARDKEAQRAKQREQYMAQVEAARADAERLIEFNKQWLAEREAQKAEHRAMAPLVEKLIADRGLNMIVTTMEVGGYYAAYERGKPTPSPFDMTGHERYKGYVDELRREAIQSRRALRQPIQGASGPLAADV